eukprot:Clim_evm48s33 gene=Clim_evmTU48s33
MNALFGSSAGQSSNRRFPVEDHEIDFFIKKCLIQRIIQNDIHSLTFETDSGKTFEVYNETLDAILSLDIWDRSPHFRANTREFLTAVPDILQSTEEEKNRKRLLKRGCNFIVGFMNMVIISQRELNYIHDHSDKIEAGHDMRETPRTKKDRAHASMQDWDADAERLRLKFLESWKRLIYSGLDRDSDHIAQLLDYMSAAHDVQELDGHLGLCLHHIANDLAISFESLNNPAELAKLKRSYNAIPWTAFNTLLKLTGTTLIRAAIDFVLNREWQGKSVFRILVENIMDYNDTLQEANYVGTLIPPICKQKADQLVLLKSPFDPTKFNNRENLEAIMISDVVEPAVPAEIFDGLSEEVCGNTFAYLCMRYETEAKDKFITKLIDDERVKAWAASAIELFSSLFREVISTGGLKKLIKHLQKGLQELISTYEKSSVDKPVAPEKNQAIAAKLVDTFYLFFRRCLILQSPDFNDLAAACLQAWQDHTMVMDVDKILSGMSSSERRACADEAYNLAVYYKFKTGSHEAPPEPTIILQQEAIARKWLYEEYGHRRLASKGHNLGTRNSLTQLPSLPPSEDELVYVTHVEVQKSDPVIDDMLARSGYVRCGVPLTGSKFRKVFVWIRRSALQLNKSSFNRIAPITAVGLSATKRANKQYETLGWHHAKSATKSTVSVWYSRDPTLGAPIADLQVQVGDDTGLELDGYVPYRFEGCRPLWILHKK